MISSTRTTPFAVLALALMGGCTDSTSTDELPLTSAATVAPVADSIITNASFEKGLTGWSLWYGTSARSTTQQRSGTGCLKLGAAGGAEIQDVTAGLQVGHTYHLSGYIKATSTSQVDNVAIGMYGTDSAGDALLNNAAAVTSYSTSYQQVSMDFTYPANVVQTYVYAQLEGGTGGAAYFDDFQLVDTSSSTGTTTSPSGTTIPPSSQIVDSSGNTWTVTAGVIYENGSTAAFSQNVTLLLYYDGVIYQENSAGGWWSWTGTAWVDATDPRGSGSGAGSGSGSGAGSGSGSGSGSGGSTVTVSADFETYGLNAGPFWADNSTWNSGNLVNGTDYTQSITLNTSSFPNGTKIAWSWPNTPATFNVYSYPGVFWGDYQNFTPPATTITPQQIKNINTLQIAIDLVFGGSTDEYDAIFDMYLTSAPGLGDGSFELEIAVHEPSYYSDWLDGLPQTSFTDSQGLSWSIANNTSASPHMVVFAPTDHRDLTNYTIDFKALLDAAKAAGIFTGNEYFDGLALGNEPQMGTGSMTINSFSINYQ